MEIRFKVRSRCDRGYSGYSGYSGWGGFARVGSLALAYLRGTDGGSFAI